MRNPGASMSQEHPCLSDDGLVEEPTEDVMKKSEAAARRKKRLLQPSGLCEEDSVGVGRRKEKRSSLMTILPIPLSRFFFLKQIPRTGDLSKREEKQWGSGFAVGQWLSPQGA